MRIGHSVTCFTCYRDDDDPKFYGVKEAKGESNFFHWLKKQLSVRREDVAESIPTDWVKKRMWKDGHMMDEMQQYLRSRKPVVVGEDGTKYYLCLYNPNWAIQGAEYYWNDGSVTLRMEIVTICTPELSRRDPDRIMEQSKKNWDAIGQELGIV